MYNLTFDPSGVSPATFAFVGPPLLKVGSTDLTVRQKFERGEIDDDQIETMEDRGRAAEALLIEDAHRRRNVTRLFFGSLNPRCWVNAENRTTILPRR